MRVAKNNIILFRYNSSHHHHRFQHVGRTTVFDQQTMFQAVNINRCHHNSLILPSAIITVGAGSKPARPRIPPTCFPEPSVRPSTPRACFPGPPAFFPYRQHIFEYQIGWACHQMFWQSDFAWNVHGRVWNPPLRDNKFIQPPAAETSTSKKAPSRQN